MTDQAFVAANVERFKGFADDYDRYRPAVPPVIVDILTQLARMARPKCVVDIGSGTGLSTRVWGDRADEVIGIEPGDDMRHQAGVRTAGPSPIRYRKGYSTATGLPDGCADIVTISQALHWMEPTGTFAEIARILRPGGVFAAIDNDWPVIVDWEAECLDQAFDAHCDVLIKQYGFAENGRRWNKAGHLERIAASGYFRYTREIAVHHMEMGDAERLVGLALSQGSVQTPIKNGVSAEELGVPAFRAEARRILGDGSHPFYFTYRVRIGVK
jgi:SAM-dependent methyltransferase